MNRPDPDRPGGGRPSPATSATFLEWTDRFVLAIDQRRFPAVTVRVALAATALVVIVRTGPVAIDQTGPEEAGPIALVEIDPTVRIVREIVRIDLG